MMGVSICPGRGILCGENAFYQGGNGMCHQKKPKDPKHLCELAKMADEPDSTDVLGSYTGMAQDQQEPVQDADDL